MNAIELYKFINEHNIEWHYGDNDGTEDVIIFPLIYQIEQFFKIIPNAIYDEEGLEFIMKDGYFAIWMLGICESCDIELSEVFNREDEP